VKLVVGAVSHARPSALEFAFSVLKSEPDYGFLEGCALEIEERPATAECRECGREYRVEGLSFECPACGATRPRLKAGQELYVDYYEGE